MAPDILRFRIGQSLLLVGPITTFAINPWTSYDPISVVKLSVISTLSFLALFLMLSHREITKNVDKSLKISMGLFVLFLFSSFLFSGAPMDQQLWGVFGRSTGLLAYFSLGIILFATAVLCDVNFYQKIVYVLILTAIPMDLYCFIQLTGNDPIKWSSFETFGTLGNVNFLSAYLGIVSVATTAYIVSRDAPIRIKSFFAILLVCNLFIVQSTGSVQGLFVFVFGVVVIIFVKLKRMKLFSLTQLGFVVMVTLMGIPSIAGLANKGPLAPYLFQNSNLLRTDYWHAGLEMTQRNPFFGVGMDTYGDWYREARGEISTLRGSPDRTANTAHNIFLDISSNGGFPLLIAYIALMLCALRASFRVYKRLGRHENHIFVALFASWCAYQVQALVSINQLGVGVWGWLLTGALIGYERSQRNPSDPFTKPIISRNFKAKLLPASSAIMGVAGMGLGFIFAWFPLNADSNYYSAMKSRDFSRIYSSAEALGSTAWHRAGAINYAYQSQAWDKAQEMALKMTEGNSRDFFGWRYLMYAPNSSAELKSLALAKLKELDPYNPEFKTP